MQLPLENIAEFQEPDIEQNMKKVKEMGISFGIHGETHALGGEAIQLDSALMDYYIRIHQKVEVMLRESGKLGSKYVLLHSSESPGFLQLGQQMQPTILVDFWGRPLRKFLEENKWLVDWATEKKFIMELCSRRIREHDINKYVKMVEEHLKGSEKVRSEIDIRAKKIIRERSEERQQRGEDPRLTEDEQKSIISKVTEEVYNEMVYPEAPKMAREEFMEAVEDFPDVSEMVFGSERFAYYLIAKWMERTNQPLWERIVSVGVKYYAKINNKTEEEWLAASQIKELSMDDDNFRYKTVLWFPAVSAQYIWGHFTQHEHNSDSRLTNLTGILEKYDSFFVIESPMVSDEEHSRLPNPLQMLELMKHFRSKHFGVAFDIEHILSANINPETAFSIIEERDGEYVKVIHIGWPSPLAPAHIPIPLGSEQQQQLYRMLFQLRKKGTGSDNLCYIIFERGGGDDPYKQSFLALRNIVEYLDKDVEPDKLPPEFYGIDTKQLLSPEKQKVAIREHAYDPLKGLITVPEEEHGLLGKAALEKGKRPEEWAKERFK